MPGHPPGPLPIQVVLTLYESPLDILKNFDVDCCCIAFVPSEGRVVTTRRGLRALRYGTNICDSAFDSSGYCRRLEKYDARGFRIAVPGFEQNRLSDRILTSNYAYHEHHDVLLRIAPSTHASDQDGDPVRHFERLVVLKFAGHKVRFRAPQVGRHDWATSDSDDEEYSPTPRVAVTALLERCQLNEEDGVLPGGCIPKHASMARAVKAYVVGQLSSHSKLQFVYDFCKCDTPFAALHYVLDAARPPLDCVDDHAFKRAYGIERRLAFTEACARSHRLRDWWTVYD